MAVSVLGKRSRQSEDVTVQPAPSKRRTRRSSPQIYEDEVVEDAITKGPVNGRNVSSIRNIQTRNRKAGLESNKSNANHTLSLDETVKENVPPNFQTPTAVRFKDVFSSSPPSTPKHRVRLAGKLLTPRSNRVASPKPQSVYAAARQLFTQGSELTRLVGRESERQQLLNFLSNGVKSKSGGCTYVSGPPGTGKSALVQEMIQGFASKDQVKISIINCVTTKSSQEIFGKLAEDLGIGALPSGKTPKDIFSKLFTSKAKSQMHLVLLDEIDSLLDADCGFLYSLFEWAMHRSSSLLLIGIANALDLTDRFLPRLKGRNLVPQLLPFLPYTAVEMSNIITQKLQSLVQTSERPDPGFVPFLHPAAIQLIGKKIASQTGDLRKAFNLARCTVDLIEQEAMQKLANSSESSPTKQPLAENSNMAQQLPPTPPKSSPLKPVTPVSSFIYTFETAPRASIAHVARLASTIFNNGTVSRLSSLNLQQKAVLCSLVANESRREARDPFKTPSKSATKILTVKDLFEKYAKLCRRDEGLLQPLKNTEFRDVVASLETLGLVQECSGRNSTLNTATKTPSRMAHNADERRVVSAVSEKEMQDSLRGPGADLLQRLFDEC